MQKTSVRVPILGHSGHGKTSLLRALAQRFGRGGASSETFEYETPTHHVTLFDTNAGVEEVTQALTGHPSAAAVLVVSATDGVLPGTRDAVQAARQSGVRTVIILLNKCDLVEDAEMLDLVEMEIRELLNRFKFSGDEATVLKGAVGGPGQGGHSRWGETVAEVLAAIDRSI
jgi:elongation factor Tu